MFLYVFLQFLAFGEDEVAFFDELSVGMEVGFFLGVDFLPLLFRCLADFLVELPNVEFEFVEFLLGLSLEIELLVELVEQVLGDLELA